MLTTLDVAAHVCTEVMSFGGAPEIINGRLAMLGFVAAVAAELSSGAHLSGTGVYAMILHRSLAFRLLGVQVTQPRLCPAPNLALEL